MDKAELEAIFAETGASLDLGPIEDYIHALGHSRRLPGEAVGMCLIRIEEAAPFLIDVLARAADGEALTEAEETLVFRGLYILGGARVEQAWPLLMRLLRRPEEEIDQLLGDGVTEGLGRIAAGLFDGDVEGLLAAILDLQLDEFIRDALFGAATFLTWDGRIERDRMRDFLTRFYEGALAPADDYGWIGWLEAIAHLGMVELKPLVRQAWDQGYIQQNVMNFSDFESDLREALAAPDDLERMRRRHLGYIDDAVEAMNWVSEDGPDYLDEVVPWDDVPDPIWPRVESGFDWPAQQPVTNPLRHVGRNDPCPCGSGKKAKKCCLA